MSEKGIKPLKQNPDTLVPKYKNHKFVGYAVVGKDNKEKAVIPIKDFYGVTNDGCPEGVEVHYGKESWFVDDYTLQQHMQPELVYVPTGKRAGEYQIKQDGKTLGVLEYKDLKFKKVTNSNGVTKYKMTWTNEYDGQTRFIGYISPEEKAKMDKENQPKANELLRENGQVVDTSVQEDRKNPNIKIGQLDYGLVY